MQQPPAGQPASTGSAKAPCFQAGRQAKELAEPCWLEAVLLLLLMMIIIVLMAPWLLSSSNVISNAAEPQSELMDQQV